MYDNLEYYPLTGTYEKFYKNKKINNNSKIKNIAKNYENRDGICEDRINWVLYKISKQCVKYNWFEDYNLVHNTECLPNNKITRNAVNTCIERGLVEYIPNGRKCYGNGVINGLQECKLTTAGWNKINTTRKWVITGIIINFTQFVIYLLLKI